MSRTTLPPATSHIGETHAGLIIVSVTYKSNGSKGKMYTQYVCRCEICGFQKSYRYTNLKKRQRTGCINCNPGKFRGTAKNVLPGIQKMPAGNFSVRINVDNKIVPVGTYSTESDAIKAIEEARSAKNEGHFEEWYKAHSEKSTTRDVGRRIGQEKALFEKMGRKNMISLRDWCRQNDVIFMTAYRWSKRGKINVVKESDILFIRKNTVPPPAERRGRRQRK